ncbi:MAG TPA: L-serine ammonia-lyase, iron-sulfur-dependent subunit beta [Savagea sp.]
MKFRSVFEVIGPVMVGPSSSHTAGAARIGRVARKLFGRQPKWAKIYLYESFAETYQGHGTDVAMIGGLLGFDTFDDRIRTSFELAQEAGMTFEFIPTDEESDHPNTARLLIGDEESEMELVGISIGGGTIEVIELNGFTLRLSGHFPALLIVHNDRSGVIANVSNAIAELDINIAHMEVGRKEKGEMALMVIEVDQVVDEELMIKLRAIEHVTQVSTLAE